jgi:hypothetical protein
MKIAWLVVALIPVQAFAQGYQFHSYQPIDLGQVMLQAEQIKTLQAEQELLEAQAAAERERTQRRQQEAANASSTNERTDPGDPKESDVRFLKFLDQTGACQRLYPSESEQSVCIDRLKLADADFARTWIDAVTPGAESPMLHAHRAELVRKYLQAHQSDLQNRARDNQSADSVNAHQP